MEDTTRLDFLVAAHDLIIIFPVTPVWPSYHPFLSSAYLSSNQPKSLSRSITHCLNGHVVITVKPENGVCDIGRKYLYCPFWGQINSSLAFSLSYGYGNAFNVSETLPLLSLGISYFSRLSRGSVVIFGNCIDHKKLWLTGICIGKNNSKGSWVELGGKWEFICSSSS